MAYVTQEDIEAFTGYINADFKQGDQRMTPVEWTAFVDRLIAGVEGAIHKFCRVPTFAVETYHEKHDGRGQTGGRGGDKSGIMYTELDRTYLPREQPVQSVIRVAEDVGYPGPVSWVDRVPRSETTAGDFQVLNQGITSIRFLNNVPRKGLENVLIEYTAGYPDDSDVLDDIRIIETEFIANYLARKKRDQETQAARREPTRDAAEMIREIRPNILSKEIKERLAPYQRLRTGSKMWR